MALSWLHDEDHEDHDYWWSAHNDPSRFIPLYCQKSFPQLFDVTELNVKLGHLNIYSGAEYNISFEPSNASFSRSMSNALIRY